MSGFRLEACCTAAYSPCHLWSWAPPDWPLAGTQNWDNRTDDNSEANSVCFCCNGFFGHGVSANGGICACGARACCAAGS